MPLMCPTVAGAPWGGVGPGPNAGRRPAPCAAHPWPGRRSPGRSPRGTPTTVARRVVPAQPAGDLFGRPLPGAEQALHLVPQPRGSRSRTAWAAGRLIGTGLGRIGPILVPAPIGSDLPADRAPMPTEAAADLGVGLTRSIPTRISSRSSSVNAPVRGFRSRSTTTPCSRMRSRSVDTPIPAAAAASSTLVPRATEASAARTDGLRKARRTSPRPEGDAGPGPWLATRFRIDPTHGTPVLGSRPVVGRSATSPHSSAGCHGGLVPGTASCPTRTPPCARSCRGHRLRPRPEITTLRIHQTASSSSAGLPSSSPSISSSSRASSLPWYQLSTSDRTTRAMVIDVVTTRFAAEEAEDGLDRAWRCWR